MYRNGGEPQTSRSNAARMSTAPEQPSLWPAPPPEPETPAPQANAWQGWTFAFTGALSVTRKEAAANVERLGGRVAGRSSQKADLLVSGKKPGKAKTRTARKNRTPTLNEEQFHRLLNAPESIAEVAQQAGPPDAEDPQPRQSNLF